MVFSWFLPGCFHRSIPLCDIAAAYSSLQRFHLYAYICVFIHYNTILLFVNAGVSLNFHRTGQLCPGQLHIEERLASFLKLQINETVDILTFPLYTFYKEVLSWILIMSYIKSFIT